MARLFAVALAFVASFAFADTTATLTSGWITSTYPKVRQPLADRIAESALARTSEHGLPFNIFISLIAKESGFNPSARSSEGAKGLTQVMERYHKDKIRGRNLYNPDVGIEVGAIVLNDCYVKHKKSIDMALRCYHGYQGKASTQYVADVRKVARQLDSALRVLVTREPSLVDNFSLAFDLAAMR